MSLSPIVRRFVEDAGNLTQSLGAGRVLGQLYAFLYLSPSPRNLTDMQDALGISKGSASTVVRQLEQWGAVRKVWIKGDRKDYYEASDWFGHIIKNAIAHTVGKKMASYGSLVDEMSRDAETLEDGDGGAFVKQRIERLQTFQKKAQAVWGNPLLQHLLK